MCWPYTIIYGCMDCIASDKPPASSCITVLPGAQDPVMGGTNEEGSLCPMRWIGTQPLPQMPSPLACPSVVASTSKPESSVSVSDTDKTASSGGSYVDLFPFGCQVYRFWICALHRFKYIQLGPGFVGYELMNQIHAVQHQRMAPMLEMEIAREKRKQEKRKECFDVVSQPRSYLDRKRKQETRVKDEAEATAGIATTAHTLLKMTDGAKRQRQTDSPALTRFQVSPKAARSKKG